MDILNIIIVISAILLVHSVFNFITMSFSWNDPHSLNNRKSPTIFKNPINSFSLIIPVRNESEVIRDTMISLSKLEYPKELYEVIIVCRKDDLKTKEAIFEASKLVAASNFRLLLVGEHIDNKPKALNVALERVNNKVVGIFDAEDEPNSDILNVINTKFVETNSDVIQSGVQLMNYKSNWFSILNTLEYYFWFKSALHFFARLGVVPLGGNTIFIKKERLLDVGGWNENMLTEDADLGIRLSINNAKISIVYDEKHVTKEETPPTLSQFIRQRTRWNQGFLQILFKFDWLKLKGIRRKFFTPYLLLMPLIQGIWIVYFPLTIYASFFLKIPVAWALFSILPGYVLLVHLVLYNFALYEFTKDYNFKYSILLIPRLLLSFFPYQIVLSIASVRAISRLLLRNMAWEKTNHNNLHRANPDELEIQISKSPEKLTPSYPQNPVIKPTLFPIAYQ